MTDQENPETEKGKKGYGRMNAPAVIRERVERDPVDVALGDILTPDTGDSDSPRDSDGDTTTLPQPRHATATPAPGDSDTPERHDTPPLPGDTTPASEERKVHTRKTSRGKGKREGSESVAEDAAPETMKSASFSLPPSLLERMRAAQHHTQTKPDGHHNLSGMVRTLILDEVHRLEATHNGGRPFPKIEGKLTSGPSMEGARRGAMLRSLQARRRREEKGAESDET